MNDFTDKEIAALFAAQSRLDRASAPEFGVHARVASLDARRLRTRRFVRHGLIVAAAALIVALTLVSRSRHAAMRPAEVVDISHWSAPTDVLLRMSDHALDVPTLGTSALITLTGN